MRVSSQANPLVSIIVPSYNQGRFIRKTLDSILLQDYRPLEVIVIDGASTDETLAVLHDYDGVPELKWFSEPDRGVVDAVNKGFGRALGKLGAIQSSDDFYLPGAVRTAVEALQGDPSLGFVFGDVVKVDQEGRELSRTSLGDYSLESVLAQRMWIPQPSTFFRMAFARELGGWREEVPYAADTDLWLRIAFRANARKVHCLMAGQTMHELQRDKQGARIVRDYGRMLEELAPLQRAPAGIRRAAAAGLLRIENHYGSDQGAMAQWWRLVRTVLLYPPLLHETPVQSLIPGWYPLRQQLSRLLMRR